MTTRADALLLHQGWTTHWRFTPFKSSFRYKVCLIDVDIDHLNEADCQSRLFGVEKSALFSFRRDEHGAEEKAPLRPWAEAQFRDAGIDIECEQIRLVTFPRHLFYKFAPLSLWIAMNDRGEPAGILYEVRNTFGERHVYAAALDGAWSRHSAPKRFHVSPFFAVSGRYAFSVRYEADELHLGVTTLEDGQPVHSATLSTTITRATGSRLASIALGMPLSSLGVTIGIHWEALKLWVKGARYHRKPHAPKAVPTLAGKGRDSN
ncbi:DUF1365 domain-containing protein [Henriciella aquimarina]|uniref:DUF1365 domain-containing protein n=1 Tax=Henriciella aquimarina TaxID=545261 RepID=UPI001301E4EC|nr:DUF1365 domain-containing protein [Henriciella aquimarina]